MLGYTRVRAHATAIVYDVLCLKCAPLGYDAIAATYGRRKRRDAMLRCDAGIHSRAACFAYMQVSLTRFTQSACERGRV